MLSKSKKRRLRKKILKYSINQRLNNFYDDDIILLAQLKTDEQDDFKCTKSEKGYSALMYAYKHEHYDIVFKLINKGRNVNYKNYDNETILLLATYDYQTHGYSRDYLMVKKIIYYLIDNKADVNIVDSNKNTAINMLFDHCLKGYDEGDIHDMILKMLNSNADLTHTDLLNRTYLCWACMHACMDNLYDFTHKVINIYKEKKLMHLVNKETDDGLIALTYTKNLDIVKELISLKADINYINKYGENVLYKACSSYHHTDATAKTLLLIESGAILDTQLTIPIYQSITTIMEHAISCKNDQIILKIIYTNIQNKNNNFLSVPDELYEKTLESIWDRGDRLCNVIDKIKEIYLNFITEYFENNKSFRIHGDINTIKIVLDFLFK